MSLMINNELTEICKELRLSNLANLSRTNQLVEDEKTEWLLKLLRKEIKIRNDKKIARLYNQAKFPKRKTLNDYIWHDQINFSNEESKQQLLDLSFIENNENAVFVGTVQYPLGLTLEIIKVSVLGGILYCKLFNY